MRGPDILTPSVARLCRGFVQRCIAQIMWYGGIARPSELKRPKLWYIRYPDRDPPARTVE